MSCPLSENEIAKIVVDAAYQIHVELGPGLLESVYCFILAHELRRRGLEVEREVPVEIEFRGIRFDEGFRADLIINRNFIVEVKSVEAIHAVHKKQLLTYLRLTQIKLGLLINFGENYIKNGIHRVVNGLEDDSTN